MKFTTSTRSRNATLLALAQVLLLLGLWGCSGDTAQTDEPHDAPDSNEDAQLASDAHSEPDTPDAAPGPPPAHTDKRPEIPPTLNLPMPRGWRLARGVIHSHTPFSHDACDGKVRNEDGTLNRDLDACLQDYRHGLCHTYKDFAFNTDHAEFAALVDFEELLHIQPGDAPVLKNDAPIANRMACADRDFHPLIMAGGEFGTMPIGLERHIEGTPQERTAAYKEATPERVQSLKDLGAVVIQAHTEEHPPERLAALGLDGFEIYNLHANLDPRIRPDHLGLESMDYLPGLLAFIESKTMAPDLAFLSFWEPNRPALYALDHLLGQGHHLFGTAGTDSHQNVLNMDMIDGERADSFRRMMSWFSNYVLTDEMSPDAIKAALRQGRAFVGFDVFGTPVGFDFRAEAGENIAEMGQTISLADAPELILERPSIYGIDGHVELTLRIIRAHTWQADWKDGGQPDVVAQGPDTLHFSPTEPGAYRAEILVRPTYLTGLLDSTWNYLAEQEFVWIYANAIYID